MLGSDSFDCEEWKDVMNVNIQATIQGPFKQGERPVVMMVNGSVSALVIVDDYITSSQICDEYAKWAGFKRSSIKIAFLGHNVLTMKRS